MTRKERHKSEAEQISGVSEVLDRRKWGKAVKGSPVGHTLVIPAILHASLLLAALYSSFLRIAISCAAAVVTRGNRLATLTGCTAVPGRRLQSADVVVTSDLRPGATLKGLLSLWGHPQMGTEALNVISRLHMCTVNIYKARTSIWQLDVPKWASVLRSLVN